jgi:superfamily II DNA or RNA helicase
MCPDGKVYNLEVEVNHNFFACGILVHNCHHWAPQNETYATVLQHFDRAKRLAITATHRRGDGASLEEFFGASPVYGYGLGQACADSWLVEPRQEVAPVKELDLSAVEVRDGDFTDSGLEALLAEEKPLAALVDPTIQIAREGRLRKVLIFAPTVYIAGRIAEVINRPNRCPGQAVALSGKDKDVVREPALAGFREGKYRFLVGCDLFLEGFDEPSIDMLVIARLTLKIGRYEQMIGRGTRPAREIAGLLGSMPDAGARRRLIATSSKPDLLVLDFMGNAGRHVLPRIVDLMAPGEDADVKERAEANLAKKPPQDRKTIPEEVLLARQELDAEERRKRNGILIRARYSRKEVALFGDAPEPAPAKPLPLKAFKLASEPQKNVLRNFAGFRDEARLAKMSHRQASAIISKLRKDGKWSPRAKG